MSKLKYKVSCLIEAAKSGEVDVIAHQCNCFCTMGSGIAPLIKKNFPEAWEADKATKKGDVQKLGSFSKGLSFKYGDKGFPLFIYNLYGQYGYGKRKEGGTDTDYHALESSLIAMTKELRQAKELKIGLPKLGAGLGGGDWNLISQIIESVLCDQGFDVTIYVLNEKEIPLGG